MRLRPGCEVRPPEATRSRLHPYDDAMMMRTTLIALLLLSLTGTVLAGTPRFDPDAATAAYLAKMPPAQRAQSDAYFEGGYWLQLWSFLYGAAVSLLLLFGKISARMRDLATRVTRAPSVHVFLYFLIYTVLTTIATLPLTIYAGFFRERQYGLSNQTFGAWTVDSLKGLGIGMLLGGLAAVGIYAILRRATQRWWLYGAGATIVFMAVGILISPIYIAPVFNKYTLLHDERVREPILTMAHANGISSNDVYVMDASKQTKRVSANVSGMFGTERVTLNDNLLNRTSLPEIKAVMGHEIGHYALKHMYSMLVFFGIVIVVVFAFLQWGSRWSLERWGERWGFGAVSDVASMPLLMLLASIAFFIMTPVTNTIIRVQEEEADIFGLNAAREPDGFAEVSLKLGEYRKLAPGPVEEFLFFDHPSGRNRILMAMRWKAAMIESAAPSAPKP